MKILLFAIFSISLAVGGQHLDREKNNIAYFSDFNCRVEVIDCPGWGTGSRQVCHQNGSGVCCSCGESTKCDGGQKQ